MTGGRRATGAILGLVLVLGVIALGEARSGASVPANGGVQTMGTEPRVDRIVLPNGLTLLLVVDRRAPLIGMELRYRVGSCDDPAGRPGLTSLVQNLMVRSTAHLRERDYARYFDTAGAWDSRWLVAHHQTVLRVTVPANQIALPLGSGVIRWASSRTASTRQEWPPRSPPCNTDGPRAEPASATTASPT